jgi:hypothetical protein
LNDVCEKLREPLLHSVKSIQSATEAKFKLQQKHNSIHLSLADADKMPRATSPNRNIAFVREQMLYNVDARNGSCDALIGRLSSRVEIGYRSSDVHASYRPRFKGASAVNPYTSCIDASVIFFFTDHFITFSDMIDRSTAIVIHLITSQRL